MNLKAGKDLVIISLLIVIALILCFVVSFGFEVRREEAVVALTILTNTFIGG
ncbi:hypothetical protein SAMN05660649_04335 [Desulfotomaculum arcticum]|uniref:Uncharacterized protein n=1 Tax=Desulfotruncus arcticus DSM 17038 TaxID=1121424 RepID=A0A1I2Y9Z0_9FIRM|nr:hypothetical protein [Desulfotruncus arcticus]SFH22442.1 hypothetical protein SAMN05660649_04335 [Desulfotomaculum arcticum] [Desulfotruncus arcticus DSM 17038]